MKKVAQLFNCKLKFQPILVLVFALFTIVAYQNFVSVPHLGLQQLSDSQLQMPRFDAAKILSKSCYAIDLTKRDANLSNCSALMWFEFPWGKSFGSDPTVLLESLKRFKETSIPAEAAIPEHIQPGSIPRTFTSDEITSLNLLTEKYLPASGFGRATSSPPQSFNSYIVDGFLNHWEQPDPARNIPPNGIPALDKAAGWYYHLWFGIRYIDAGAKIFGLTQANIRFSKQTSKTRKTQILTAYFKALKAYSLLRNKTHLIIKSESLFTGEFDLNGDLPKYIDLAKWVMDTDYAGSDLKVSDKFGARRACLGNVKPGEICLVDNGTFPTRDDRLSYTKDNLAGIPVSLELDGCQPCDLLNAQGSVVSSFIYPIFKDGSTIPEHVTRCSSRIRNGLSPVQQYVNSPPEIRRRFMHYMREVSVLLTQKRHTNFYFPQPLRMDQNNIQSLHLAYTVATLAQVLSPSQIEVAKSKVRYCPGKNPLRPYVLPTEASYRQYEASSCVDERYYSDADEIKNALGANGETPWLSAIYYSRPEYKTVSDFYLKVLGREADQGGLFFWVNRFRSAQCHSPGTMLQVARELAGGFFNSDEFLQKNNGNHQDYVVRLYRAILQREPDSGGLNFWTNELVSGRRSRTNVLDAFVYSPEFQNVAQNLASAGCMGPMN